MDGDFEIEKIRQEIQQEKQMKEMLQQSAAELRATVEELENRYDTIDNEGNEWKTRYETQTEINEQLERQILNLQNKVEEAKSNLKDEENKPSNSQQNKPKSPVRKPRSLERIPRLQKQQKSEERKADSLERHKQKKGYDVSKDDFYPDGRVRPYGRRHRTVRTRTGRNIQSRSSMMSNQGSNPGSIPDSKPGSAVTKSTGITINIAISPREAGKTPRDMNRFDDLSDANPHMIKTLEKEKQMLSSQLRDMEWRLDQESKAYHKANDERRNFQSEIKSTKNYQAYHKANDERKSYNLEINTTKHQQGELTSRGRIMGSRDQLDTVSGPRTPRDLSRPTYATKGPITHREPLLVLHRSTLRTSWNYGFRNSRKSGSHGSLSNIPEDQRIIDPKRGPIKKTAGVKNLPSLEMT